VNLFLCGKGEAAEGIFRWLTEQKHRVWVYSHPGAALLDVVEAESRCDYTTGSINDVERWPTTPALIVSCGYLEIMRPLVIERMQGRIINGHAALLPRHRGRSSVPWAILQGDRLTGITWHYIEAGIDTGRMLLQATCEIEPDETQGTLWPKVNRLLVDYFPAALHLALARYAGVAQEGTGSYHRAGCPHGGEIQAYWPDETVERFIRAMTYPPLPGATYRGAAVRDMRHYTELRIAERHTGVCLSGQRESY